MGSYDRKLMLETHGIIMAAAFGVCPILGIFIARYFRFFSHWFSLHVWIMLGLFPLLTIVGLTLVEIILPEGQSRFFATTRGTIGTIAALVLLPLQLFIGLIAKRIHIWDIIHQSVGVSLVVVGLYALYLVFWNVQRICLCVLWMAHFLCSFVCRI
ncbi:hypothetical protein BDR26DRAFT_865729 [Obelidium mucronatum]|nr:hypothetical protein BDR26DRAFT_865729 [Obelidium mucronatum]